MIKYETRIGKITISESYLSKLIGHEVSSCFGVVGVAPRGSRQKFFELVKRAQSADTGIKVTVNDSGIDVELHIIVSYGMNINAIAASITEKVKYAVEQNTGISVGHVLVKVDGIKE